MRHDFRIADALTVSELLAGEVENLCSFKEVPVVMLDLLLTLEDRSAVEVAAEVVGGWWPSSN